jgi:SAM-dependent methyltransferase
MADARVAYDACPLCGCEAITDVGSYDCSAHPLYKPALPRAINWCECFECHHQFTDGYFTPEALAVLLSGTNAQQEPGGQDPEHGRALWARVVGRATELRGGALGRWLDVGFGDGTLLFTAQEWGYEPLGIDLRATSVAKLAALGVPARTVALEALDDPGGFAVISMADVLEHMPFPKPALARVRELLAPDGLVFISMPNRDTVSWRLLERERRNPYLVEIEHYHNFTRARLYALLAETGFAPVWYGVSNRYRCGMEVIARRAA